MQLPGIHMSLNISDLKAEKNVSCYKCKAMARKIKFEKFHFTDTQKQK